MKTDRDDAARRAQTADRAAQAVAQRVELVVDGDAQRLKDARRRMDALAPAAAVDDAGDERGELGGRARQRAARAAHDDRAGDAPRRSLFAVMKEDVGQFALAGGREDS